MDDESRWSYTAGGSFLKMYRVSQSSRRLHLPMTPSNLYAVVLKKNQTLSYFTGMKTFPALIASANYPMRSLNGKTQS